MISLNVSSLTYRIGAATILEEVSFSLDAGDRLGIVGDNGAGKSTLLGLITGKLEPTAGDVCGSVPARWEPSALRTVK